MGGAGLELGGLIAGLAGNGLGAVACSKSHAVLGAAPHATCRLPGSACAVGGWPHPSLLPIAAVQSLRQQLQGPARLLASKRKAHELFDVPLGIAVRAAGPAGGGSAALPPSQPRQLPAPGFPQQSSRGPAGREAAEAWARQQLAAPGAPPLRSLGWGGGSDAGQVPHGFPRTRAFELLAELEVPLPRALWFLRVLALNRTR